MFVEETTAKARAWRAYMQSALKMALVMIRGNLAAPTW